MLVFMDDFFMFSTMRAAQVQFDIFTQYVNRNEKHATQYQNQMKHKPRTFLLSKSIYSSTKITDSEIMNVITLTFYTQCKKSAVF